MKPLLYDDLLKSFERYLPQSIDWNKGSKYRAFIEPILKSLIDIINNSIEIEPGTGYDWQDPESDMIAAIRQIQELLDEKL